MKKPKLITKLPPLPESTLGDRIADHIAEFGGSWAFILCFFGIMGSWIIFNTIHYFHPFDRPPFILFNLILSMLAAIQAPIIMMSQNRREIRDRLRDELDLEVDIEAGENIKILLEEVKEIKCTLKKLSNNSK